MSHDIYIGAQAARIRAMWRNFRCKRLTGRVGAASNLGMVGAQVSRIPPSYLVVWQIMHNLPTRCQIEQAYDKA